MKATQGTAPRCTTPNEPGPSSPTPATCSAATASCSTTTWPGTCDIEAIGTYEGTGTVQALIVGRDLTGYNAFVPVAPSH
ncbi:hypothetical protein ABT124_40770 [Streptomyces sp. NPDC001982]|uniref:hypothetical protein n=1 Tax=Streptomyces sp. NPDC001982 TaxID=3154405 RepID=UPI00331BA6F1